LTHFEPGLNLTVGAMLNAARSAIGTVYEGYKGGSYRMSEYTHAWLASWGDVGEPLSVAALDGMRLRAATLRLKAAWASSGGEDRGALDDAILALIAIVDESAPDAYPCGT
jgi:hypothetical protein